jgi:hypothetical protein
MNQGSAEPKYKSCLGLRAELPFWVNDGALTPILRIAKQVDSWSSRVTGALLGVVVRLLARTPSSYSYCAGTGYWVGLRGNF